MKKWNFLLLFVTFILIILPMIYADNEKLLCLSNGEVLQFSLCNPKIADRTCTSTGVCKYCVSEISQGVYCPASINICNSKGLECSKLQDSNNGDNNEDNNPNNDSVIIPPINQNSSNEDTNNNPDGTTDNSNSKSTKKTVKTTSSSDEDTVDLTNLDSNGNKIIIKNSNEGGSSLLIFLLFTTFILIGAFGFVLFKINKKSGNGKKK